MRTRWLHIAAGTTAAAAMLSAGLSGQAQDDSWIEMVGVSKNQDQHPPDVTLPESEARLVDRNGNPVLDKDGNPVTVPVTPTENAAPGPDVARRVVTGPDGSVAEEITVTPK